uniref:DUF4283 domain-containing protein n=1 Tax=Cannabis sativa TaxID=3483 RepID=A0A803QFM7_CANSA
MILGANPHMTVFERFIKRMWGHLGLQYWGSKSRSAIVSTIGKPMADQHTKDRTKLMEQRIEYEWLLVKCSKCSGFGHTVVDCRRDELKKKNVGSAKEKPAQVQGNSVKLGTINEEKANEEKPEKGLNSYETKNDKGLRIPKKTSQGKVHQARNTNIESKAVFNVDDRARGNPISLNDIQDSSLWLASAHVEALPRSGYTYT